MLVLNQVCMTVMRVCLFVVSNGFSNHNILWHRLGSSGEPLVVWRTLCFCLFWIWADYLHLTPLSSLFSWVMSLSNLPMILHTSSLATFTHLFSSPASSFLYKRFTNLDHPCCPFWTFSTSIITCLRWEDQNSTENSRRRHKKVFRGTMFYFVPHHIDNS